MPSATMDAGPQPDQAVTPPRVLAPDAADADRACEAALCEHAPLLYRIAFGVLRNRADAEDAVQDALQRAWRARRRLAGVENPAAWLARITWRAALSRRRRARRGDISLNDWPGLHTLRAAGATAEQLAASREMSRLVEALILRLPRRLRQPLILSTVEDLSARQIAYVLGGSEAAVRGRCLRARRLLRERIDAVLSQPEDRHAR